jgi:hypothetical protein
MVPLDNLPSFSRGENAAMRPTLIEEPVSRLGLGMVTPAPAGQPRRNPATAAFTDPPRL